MIQIQDLYKTFGKGDSSHVALKGINLAIEDGDIFGIIGQSGAGKSTLVRCINLLEHPSQGSIYIDGKDITNVKGKELLAVRSQIGMIFQNFSLFQQRSVLENITFPLEIRGESKKFAQSRALELLELVGLADKAQVYPSQLSGGQQQRVAIARALANKPSIMLCDEATSALDSRTTAQILDLLKSINKELGVTMILITHSLQVAEHICNKIAVIDAGCVAEVGNTLDVLRNPSNEVTKELISYGAEQVAKPRYAHESVSFVSSVSIEVGV